MQTTLALVVKKVQVLMAFSPDAILQHVTILIVTGDQVHLCNPFWSRKVPG